MVICSITLAILILSHNIMALIFFPFWLIFLYIILITYFEDIKLYTWRYFLPMILLGLGMAAFFFLPALVEKKYVLLSQTKLADIPSNFIKIKDYLFSAWSYGSKPSYQLGWAHILAGVFGIISIVFTKDLYRKKYIAMFVFILISVFIIVFLAHPFSIEFWNIPPLSWLDFPWRFLTLLAFFLALSTIFLSIHRISSFLGAILAVMTVLFSLSFATPQNLINNPDSYYATNDATTTSKDELMPVWVNSKPANRYTEKVEVEKGRAELYNLVSLSDSIKFKAIVSIASTLKVNTIYFPGWKYWANGKEINVDYQRPDGLIRLDIDKGDYEITGKLTDTPVRFWSNIISLLSIAISLFLLAFSLIRRLILYEARIV